MGKYFSFIVVLFLIFSGFSLFSGSGSGVEENGQLDYERTGVRTNKTLEVGPGKTYSKIQDAIDNASTWDTVKINPGTYYEDIVVNKSIYLVGSGSDNTPSNTVINGSNSGSTITVTATSVTISYLNITGGNSGSSWPLASGVHVKSGSADIRFCYFFSNQIGVQFDNNNYGIVQHSKFIGNYVQGINFSSSDFINVNFNTLRSNPIGISSAGSDYNIYQSNTIEKSSDMGMHFGTSTRNQIYNNIFNKNTKHAINFGFGSSLNTVYTNSFINNNQGGNQALDNYKLNYWNVSTNGNYWSDWTTPDTDKNDIVDKPYNISGSAGAKDFYPRAKSPHAPDPAPKITTPNVEVAYVDEYYYVKYTASDSDTPQNQLLWGMSTNASWLTFYYPNQTLNGTPLKSDRGYYWVNISVSDGTNTAVTYFYIQVKYRYKVPDGNGTAVIVRTGVKYPKIQYAVDNASSGDTIRMWAGSYYENIILDKKLTLIGNGSDATRIYSAKYSENFHPRIIDVQAEGCKLEDFRLTGFNGFTEYGIVTEKNNTIIKGIRIGNKDNIEYGIYLLSSNNIVTGSYIGTTAHGILISFFGNIIENNTLDYNYIGMKLSYSKSAQIRNCSFIRNTYTGIDANYWSDNNSFIGNYFSYNYKGLVLGYIPNNNNLIFNNKFENSEHEAIYASSNQNGNLIYLNSFINNNLPLKSGRTQVADYQVGKNFWDNGTAGNYWSEWTTPDNNSDGIVDFPYKINGSAAAKDNYPLTKINQPLPQPPKIVTTNVLKAIVGKLYTVQYSALDPDTPSTNLIWTLKTNASWLSFSNSQVLSGTPAKTDLGSYWVDISVTDGTFTTSTNFTLIVKPDVQPPSSKGRIMNLRTYQKYTKIQTAVNNASASDIIRVYAGTYNEDVVINKKISLIGNGSSDTFIKGTYTKSAIEVNADGVMIIGFTVTKGYGYSNGGIRLNSDNNRIESCVIKDSYYGIMLESSSQNMISNCEIKSNIFYGITLRNNSDNNEINYSSFIKNGNAGLAIWNDMDNNYIHHNSFINNSIDRYWKLQAFDDGKNNRWNTSTEGNYWFNWTSPDNNNDGIVDKPFPIFGDSKSKDYYPLTNITTTPPADDKTNKTESYLPRVVKTFPQNNSVEVSINTSMIIITFSEAMNKTSVESALTITPGINYTIIWENNEMRIVFGEKLEPNTTYTITIDTSATDLDGNNLESPLKYVITTELKGEGTGGEDPVNGGKEDPDNGESPAESEKAEGFRENLGVIVSVSAVIILIIFITLFMIVTRNRRRVKEDTGGEYDDEFDGGRLEVGDGVISEEVKDDIEVDLDGTDDMIKELKTEALGPKKSRNAKLSNEEMLAEFRRKFDRGEISKDTYDDIKETLK